MTGTILWVNVALTLSIPSGADVSLIILRELVADRATVIDIDRTGDVSRTSWTVRTRPLEPWTPPRDAVVSRFRLQRLDLESIVALLAGSDVQLLSDFLNAGPGVGDYEIASVDGTRQVRVLSLAPNHYSLKRDPTLLRVICQVLSAADAPRAWCPAR